MNKLILSTFTIISYAICQAETPTEQPKIKLYQEPNDKATIIEQFTPTTGIKIHPPKWIRVTSPDSKKSGWAKIEDLENSSNNQWSIQYQYAFTGPNKMQSETQKIIEINPKQAKKQVKAMEKYWKHQHQQMNRMIQTMSQIHSSFFNNSFFLDEIDNNTN